jgi:hypothetical protein
MKNNSSSVNFFNPLIQKGEFNSTSTSQTDLVIASIKGLLQIEIDDEKGIALKSLERMFKELNEVDPKKVNSIQLFGMIIGRYGSRLYPVFEETLPYLQVALQMQLQGLDLIQKEDFSVYTCLEDFKNTHLPFKNLNDWLRTTDEKMYPELLKLSDDEKLTFARTLLTLGATYSNLSKTTKEQLHLEDEGFLNFKTRFHQGIRELLCSMEQTPAVQKELGELYYNIFPGLYLERCKLKSGKESNLEEIEESFKIRWEAAKYNPALSMQARIHNLKACYLADFKEQMPAAKQESLKSLQLWEKVLAEPNLTKAERELYYKLFLNAKSVYGYILRESGVPLEELEELGKGYREFYEINKDRDPYSMIHLIGLCKLELHKGNKEEVLKWVAIIEEIGQKYQTWPDTANLVKQAQELKSKASNS